VVRRDGSVVGHTLTNQCPRLALSRRSHRADSRSKASDHQRPDPTVHHRSQAVPLASGRLRRRSGHRASSTGSAGLRPLQAPDCATPALHECVTAPLGYRLDPFTSVEACGTYMSR
jgi:hypothetical protein